MTRFELPAAEIDRLNRDLRFYVATFQKDMEKEVDNQGRLLLRDMINFTPPLQAGHGNTFQTVAPMTQRRQGEKAIENDLNRLYLALQKLDIIANPHSQKLAKQIRKHIRNREWEALGTLIKAVGGWKGKGTPVILDEATKEHHRKFRTKSSGRVSSSVRNPFLVNRAPSIAARKREAKAAVGYAKSGWNKAARGMKVNVPNWMGRHGGPGVFLREGRDGSYAVTMGNSVSYIQRRADSIRSRAIRTRSGQMQRQLDYWLNKRTREASAKH